MPDWEGQDGSVAVAVAEQNDRLLEVYRADPGRLEQDANIERSVSEGAYAKRQLYELLQNAADAMRGENGRCEVVLTETTLYVANTGAPVSVEGALSLMATHSSVKRGEQIGRFGLGFKSVLAVSDSPRILSRSGSIGFDRTWSRNVLAEAFPGREHYPVTRLAQPVDPTQERGRDKVLDELMSWAATVVVLPISAHRDVLTRSVRIFPSEFLLFSQHVARLDLKDRASGSSRKVTLQRGDDGLLALDDADRRSLWVIESQTHVPSRTALIDGGYQAARESVEMTWAAPVEGARVGVGAFWAYFPSSSLTTLSGIVNAPWKLADDRESLLPGPFNDELLTGVLPSLVVSALPRIHRPQRPAAVIDVLPARGKEIRSHADDIINQPVIDAVARTACIPSLGGTLRHPTKVRLHPEKLEADELELWRSACRDPEWWVDHSILSAERRSKVTRLLGLHDRSGVTAKEWLEHLVHEGTVEGSATAVRLVAKIAARQPELRAELTSARVLLLDDGTMHACRPGQVFLPGGTPQPGKLIIDSRLAGFREVNRALQSLGISLLDEAGALRSELTSSPIRWENVWLGARRIPLDEAEETFRETLGPALLTTLRVRVRSGRWKGPGRAFLPGAVVPADGSRDGDNVVDDRYHEQDSELLQRLGMESAPRVMSAPPVEPWRVGVEARLREEYRKKKQRPKLPDESIEIETARICWPLEPLKDLSPEGRAALTAAILTRLDADTRWTIALRDGTGRMTTPDPTWTYLRTHGLLHTEIGIQPIGRCLAYDEGAVVVDGIRQPLPYVDSNVSAAVASALRLRTEPSQLSGDDWSDLIEQAGGWSADRRALLYAWAAWCDQPAPDRIRAERGRGFVKAAPHEVAVTATASVYESLLTADCPVLLAASAQDSDLLREHWGLAAGEDLLEETLEPDFAGEPFLALDRFPPLRTSLPAEWHDLMVQPCSRLELLTATPTGQRSRPLDERRVNLTVLTIAASDRDLLLSIGRAIGITVRPDILLRRMEELRQDKNRLLLADTPDLHRKLILAIGADALRASIPQAALAALAKELGHDLDELETARLAIAVDGYAVLQNHSAELERNGLQPPGQWAGSRGAREWVRRLGFPTEFAGVPGDRRIAEVEVEGPPILGDLHPYQQKIAGRIHDLLRPNAESRRGLVPLPTGAGKTRVAVQALVEYMTETPGNTRVIWIAETDELCEQAIQTWSQVWRAKGSPGRPMTLSRLWAGNEANERDGKQVVVASVAKLDAILNRGDQRWETTYGWLANPTIIVVDEAHRSIGPHYSQVLTRLGGAIRVADMATPLLGLTATPFRGWNERETETLAGRYHRNRLDTGVFPGDDVYGFLQEMGVLARVRQIALNGATITMTEAELADAKAFRRVPEALEQRLGRDEGRNNTIIRSLLDLPEQSTVLLFASSVENARVLAAMLTYHGIEARAISGKTDTAARRHYIDEFRARRIRVLTNYNVFTEGFDVPSVDGIYITRPTFSPNVYQQMIGRGLRGRLNGGKDEVLVVNVADNLTNFGEEFAFRHFEHLWNGAET